MLTKPIYSRIFFDPDKGAEGGGNGGGTSNEKDGKESQNAKPGGEQGDEGFKPINSEAELSAWKSSTRKAIADDVRKELAEEQRKRDEEAKTKAEQDEAVKRGEFDKVLGEKDAEVVKVTGERDDLKSRVDQYEALAAKRVDALKAELKLPKEWMEDYPEDADSLEKLSWLETRGHLWTTAKTAEGGPSNGVKLPKTPDADGKLPEFTKDQQAANARHFASSF